MKVFKLIGLGGKAGSGKSSVGAYLCARYGARAYAFADELKELVRGAFRFSEDQMEGFTKEYPDTRFGASPRWCLQRMGDVCREIWPDIWIWHLRRKIMDFLSCYGAQPLVVTDVRFVNEAEALRRLGAVLIRLERPGLAGAVGGQPGHASETSLDGWTGWDHVVINDQGLAELFARVDGVLGGHTGPLLSTL